ncbi:MAG TPA: YceI family protein [Pyrinomonadaceae bacterium]|jgi:polyisoprenoid-binding protein YceI
MKKISFLLGLFLIGLFVFSNLPIDASKNTIYERFKVDTKKDVGPTGAYNFDKAHTFIGFRVQHMGLIEVPGYFRDFTGTVNYDASDIKKSTVEFTAKIASVDTGAGGRNAHLQKPEFFDAAKFPEMKFKSTKIEKKGKQWMLTGDLTIRDVTKSVTFPFEIVGFIAGDRGTRMGMTAETTINRREFGVTYDSKLPNGTPAVSDDIKVTLQIEANMDNPAATKTDE